MKILIFIGFVILIGGCSDDNVSQVEYQDMPYELKVSERLEKEGTQCKKKTKGLLFEPWNHGPKLSYSWNEMCFALINTDAINMVLREAKLHSLESLNDTSKGRSCMGENAGTSLVWTRYSESSDLHVRIGTCWDGSFGCISSIVEFGYCM